MAGVVTSLFFTGDSAYCVHHGDETRTRSWVCRIDRQTGELTGVVFDCEKNVEDCSFDPYSRPTGWPGTWSEP
ncbi:hypothetical protein GCM10022223_44490 [Kineosporia mesophila]|uniref:Uncharacterized protein n=1 Tax=Kineosporia mesophila TaxID=566012 RepID=A0ABP6ZYV8_9ACTN|nr:hypothetical protein [Kineosporia mesophila]MCD5348871.1 hypothetical protein [Kineosporia mesophila]